MQKRWVKNLAIILAVSLLTPVAMPAQKDEKADKGDKGDKDKKEVHQIIITTKGYKKEKIVVEIDGDKVNVNGKPLEEYKDKNGDIKVNMHKLKDLESLSYLRTPRAGIWNLNEDGKDGFTFFSGDEKRAMLGVTTEKDADGAKIQEITKESAAEKAGLKEDDIITKLGDAKIESPDDLSEAVKKHKPGDKVTVTYLRDKKEQKATAELTKWKGLGYTFTPGRNFDMNLDKIAPKIHAVPDVKIPFDQYRSFSWSGGSPKLGLSVQDTDDGKGVKVVDVDDDSNAAKAGIKEDDIITHLDDKAVNNVDEISRMLKEKKDQPTVRFQLTRNGKSQNIEVKMPRKIKTADL
ncbi:MAG: PDZ domain-containing protein [Bacteroidota bacterium]